ncbi:hypothetical protein [Spirilliplanes yamanashiensis]|uniref:Uncharacterized protein n=1 Tax=Spirilliplanes yamanashiensis TaxID=42233 RepID=A0A8J3Y924_9ACTN|nr:hypothetical protein [Spirilliplanes yamanashiensis]MDP9815325.1 hypothetical protein [Spirilliplanes yamanashiensis]GIJ03579.1 hypothetical protein Sya03_29310 [Spirilliplanes yamanashiensis]
MTESQPPAALPSYSMPPAAPTSGQPRIYQSTGAWPAVGGARQGQGQGQAQATAEPDATRTQVVRAPEATQVVPAQRGTVYEAGELEVGDRTMAVPTHAYHDAVENTGSLTGHILNQGWSDIGQQQSSRNNRKVVIIMAVVLLALVGISVIAVLAAGNMMSGLFGGFGQ